MRSSLRPRWLHTAGLCFWLGVPGFSFKRPRQEANYQGPCALEPSGLGAENEDNPLVPNHSDVMGLTIAAYSACYAPVHWGFLFDSPLRISQWEKLMRSDC